MQLVNKLREIFPGCIILKNDPSYMQGVPDIILLFENMWAMLEIKITALAHKQPNQEYYIALLNRMSFASFIYPENEEDVLYDLQLAFGLIRPPRVS
jgi:3-hydroxymyristoyl/3-hydroxydecanoyl-(acyl carrier protein) dehydratase